MKSWIFADRRPVLMSSPVDLSGKRVKIISSPMNPRCFYLPEQVKREMLAHMEQSIKVLKSGLSKVQTGRANPAMVEDVSVDYYGASTPLKQLATIVAPDANLLVVQPYDKTQMASFEKAILAADLGLNPASDGKVVRIKIPKLSEERRRDLTRVIKTKGEETKVALRNVRRDANEKLEQMKGNGDISEDDYHRYREKNDKSIHDYSKKVDDLVTEKSEQLQTI
jgi:ribosome recycling factor